MLVYTSGSQPAQYFGETGLPMFYGPWGNIVQENEEGYYIVFNGIKYPISLSPYTTPSYF